MMDNSGQDELSLFSKYWLDNEAILKIYLSGAIYNRSDIQDLLQKIAICAFRKFSEFNPEYPFRAWIIGIARYEVLGYYRDYGRKKEMVNSEVADALAVNLEDKAQEIARQQQLEQKILTRMVNEMPAAARRLLQLRYQDGLSCREIADKLHQPEGTIRTNLCRLREKMRRYVRQHALLEQEL